jgi:hypothetical protein
MESAAENRVEKNAMHVLLLALSLYRGCNLSLRKTRF